MRKINLYTLLFLIIFLRFNLYSEDYVDKKFLRVIERGNKNIEKYKKKIEENKFELKFYFSLAESFRLIGNYEEAINWFKILLNKDPLYFPALIELGNLYNAVGRFEDVLNLSDEMKGYYEKSPSFYILKMKIYLNLFDLQNAKNIYIENPYYYAYSESERLLGEVYLEEGKIDDAYVKFMDALKLNPKNERLYSSVAKYYFKIGKLKESKENFEKSLEVEWGYPGKDGIKRKKIFVILEILKDKSSIPEYDILKSSGDRCFEKEWWLDAYANYYLAFILNPKDTDLIYKLGVCNKNVEDGEEARYYFSRYLKSDKTLSYKEEVENYIKTAMSDKTSLEIEEEKSKETIIVENVDYKDIESTKARVQKIRKINFNRDVKVKVGTPGVIMEILKKKFEDEYSDEKLKSTYTIATRFGFIPEEINKEKFLQAQANSIAGIYFEDDETLYVIGNPKSKKSYERIYFKDVLLHELTHALQDQNFTLLKSLKEIYKENSDIGLAYKALIEGDATFTELLSYIEESPYLSERWIKEIPIPTFEKVQETIEEFFEGEDAPSYLAINSIFPYLYGEYFVLKLWKKGRIEAINKAYENPPVSTEQIVHPEKYIDNIDNPVEIEISKLPQENFKEYKLLGEDTLGEFNIFLMFKEQYLSVDEVCKMTEGWDGDRYSVYENDRGDVLLLWYTVWDSEKDAEEFYDGYKKFLKEKNLPMEKIEESKTKYILQEISEIYYGELRNNTVVIIEGANEENINSLIELIWKSDVQYKCVDRCSRPA